MHRRFIEPSNPDVLAFHEAFADLVALFQHFSLPEVLRHQIAATRGDLASQNLLGELAQQFGQATGLHGALRTRWAASTRRPASGSGPSRTRTPTAGEEPHARGALLVAAVFDAFLTIYKAAHRRPAAHRHRRHRRAAGGAVHPDLVNRLADEAAKSASTC